MAVYITAKVRCVLGLNFFCILLPVPMSGSWLFAYRRHPEVVPAKSVIPDVLNINFCEQRNSSFFCDLYPTFHYFFQLWPLCNIRKSSNFCKPFCFSVHPSFCWSRGTEASFNSHFPLTFGIIYLVKFPNSSVQKTSSVLHFQTKRRWDSCGVSYKSPLQRSLTKFSKLRIRILLHVQSGREMTDAFKFVLRRIYSAEQSPSWEANRFSASQEIPHILWNPKIDYPIHTCPPLVSNLSPLGKCWNSTFNVASTFSCQLLPNATCTIVM